MPVLHSSSSGTNESSPRAMVMNPAFERYIGIDYSGAQTPSSSLKGLRLYAADRTRAPEEVLPPPSPHKYWTRKEIAEWLVERLSEELPTLVGIDHGFRFHWNTSRNTVCPSTGRHSLTTSSATGRPTRTSMSILCVKALPETAQPV